MAKNVLKTKVEKMDLSIITYNCLKRSGYNTVGDIVDKTKKEFRKCKNLGEKSYDEVVANLEKLGLNFRKK